MPALKIGTSSHSGSGVGAATANKPAGTVENDVMLCHITAAYLGSTQSVSPPPGWILVRDDIMDDGTGKKLYAGIYWKKAGPSEGATYSFQFSGGGNPSIDYTTTVATFRGLDINAVSPIDDHQASVYDSGTDTDILSPSVVSSMPNEWMLIWFSNRSASVWTPQSGMNEDQDVKTDGTLPDDCSESLCTLISPNAGPSPMYKSTSSLASIAISQAVTLKEDRGIKTYPVSVLFQVSGRLKTVKESSDG